MPRKERLRKEKERDLQQAAQGSSSLLSWMKAKENEDESQSQQGSSSMPSTSIAEEGDIETDEAATNAATGSVRPTDTDVVLSEDHSEEEQIDHIMSKLAALQYPTDPTHIHTFKIKRNDRYVSMCCNVGPCQPDIPYPKTEGRSFQKQWFSANVWLEYSPTANSMHCFSCRLFLSDEKYKSRTAWTTDGIRKWSTALEKIKQHSSAEMHMTSMVRWINFQKKALQSAFDVSDVKGVEVRERERQTNKEILTRLIDLTVYLARQGQAFRGHDESESSDNRGNFRELVNVFSRYDSVLKMHLEKIATVKATKTRPQVSLLSNRSQNDIIAALGTYIRKEIQREIKEAEMYSILLDETSDVSHKEQVSFVVRYFHHMQIKERFIEVCNVDTTTGQELENTVFLLMQKNGLEMKNMYGQGYDGAANMSGMYKGLQARIRAHNEKALYVHCKAHCLNLVLVEASKSSKHFVTFFNLVEKLYAFCSGSPKRHAALVKFQESLFPGQRVMELQQLSDTRWACREKALKALQRNLKAILMLLDDISDSDPPNLAQGDAQMYRNAINFMFILCMEITTPVFEVTALASDSLQEEGLDHSTAYKVIDGVLHTLQTMRSEEKFGEIFRCASEKAESFNIPVPTVVPGQERKRKVPVRFQHSTTVSQVGAQFESVEAYFRSGVYFTFLDIMTGELNRRFKGDNTGSPTARIIQSFQPLTVHANWVGPPNPEAIEAVHILCEFYGEDEDQLKTELKVFHSSFSSKDLREIFLILRENNGQLIFPAFVKMIQIYATLPVTTATVERSFSKLKIIKNKLRSLCGEERLSDLLLLAIEKDVEINYNEVINIYKDMAPRRMLL
ncbi:zinc finger MYM-type protein 1 isoform X2 [Oreochromis niloticus]|nr:zinc finger MYM-type protein 1-like isoform X2 [Oreochromis niloticus]